MTLVVPVLWELFSALPLHLHLTGLRADVQSVFTQAQGQWQTFAALFLNACAWGYAAVFLHHHRRSGEKPGLDVGCLFVLLGLIGLHYALRYDAFSHNSDVLVLVGGIWLGSLWHILLPSMPRRAWLLWFWLVAAGMALVSLPDWPLFQVFHYRGERRATGLWNNPNTFGLLAACLAAACLAWLLKLAPWRQQPDPLSAPNRDLQTRRLDRRAWLLLLPLVAALIGLVRSYSRGAWLGLLLALIWCGWWQFGPALRHLRHQARAGVRTARRRQSILRLLAVTLVCGGLLALCGFKDFQNPLLRRLGTVTNRTDRSWRNRVDAWIGATRMVAERPLTGWGLGRVEEVFQQQFKPPYLKESGAIQLNDYLTLAAGLGLPALGAFLLLIGPRLRTAHRERNPNVAPLLVLLVGGWFDGVLFRLALAIPFWTLLLAGTRDSIQPFSLRLAWGKCHRMVRHVGGKKLGADLPAPLREVIDMQRFKSVAPRGFSARTRFATVRYWLARPRVRLAWGFGSLLLLVGYIYYPEIPGGLRDRLDPWVRQAAAVVAGQSGTAAKADALHDWLHARNQVEPWTHEWFGELDWASAGAQGGCRAFSETYARLGHALGLKVRPVYTFWPTIGNSHYWVEIWDAEHAQWHPYDVSAENRFWDTPWLHRVPKAISLVPTDQPGSWAAHDHRQWEQLENTIGSHYPSGQVEVTVLDHDQPRPGARVEVQVWLGDGMGGHAAHAYKFLDPQLFSVLAGRTDTNGLVRFTLGRSAQQPYRLHLDRPGDADWAWVAVNSNSFQRITLRLDRRRPCDLRATPPRLAWFQDEE